MDTGTESDPGGIQSFRLKFTGDGGIYFGIWLVNLLLMIVTLSLYTPFARRRTAKYFYANTVVAGSPLEFTGSIRRMVFGFLLLITLYVAYQLAEHTAQKEVVAVFLLGGLALSPLLWAGAMRFRMNATRWRGIRGRFSGSLGEVYRASWPVLVAAGAWAGFTLVFGQSGLGPGLKLLAAAAAVLATLLCLVRLEFNYASLFFSRVEFGSQPGRWKPVYRDFVMIWLAAVGFFLAVVVVFGVVIGALAGGSFWALSSDLSRRGPAAVMIIASMVIAVVLMLVLASGPARAYREARMFNLIWSNVGLGGIARFRSELSVRGFVLLRIKNMLLSMLTFGFYRPFALTSEYRMKTESVTLHVKGGLEQLVGQLASEQGAVGDAMADALGLDLVG